MAEEQQRPDVQEQRQDWSAWQKKLTLETIEHLVFWDETATLTNMVPLYGRSLPGIRIKDHVPHGTWERLTLIGGVRLSGLCGSLMYEGGTTVEACQAFIFHELGPTLKKGDIVIMDNLSSHVSPKVIAALEELGVTVKTLPPYSPDLNPIEKVWSKLKTALRRARPRTAEDLIQAVGTALDTITPQDILGWFQHCGYHTYS